MYFTKAGNVRGKLFLRKWLVSWHKILTRFFLKKLKINWLGSAPKNRVSRETGNKPFFFFCLIKVLGSISTYVYFHLRSSISPLLKKNTPFFSNKTFTYKGIIIVIPYLASDNFPTNDGHIIWSGDKTWPDFVDKTCRSDCFFMTLNAKHKYII